MQAFLLKLNPDAEQYVVKNGSIKPELLINRHLFDFDKASQGAGWIKELNEEHVPETEEYGISSFVYRRRRPFHPQRWYEWLENLPVEIVRAKGFFWLASRNIPGILSQAGASIQFQGAGEWIADLPKELQEAELKDDLALRARWDETYGDKQTELVFIGIELEREEIECELDRCLLTDAEMQADWTAFPDPLPKFIVHN